MRLWRMKANEASSPQKTFTLKKQQCPPVKIINTTIPEANDVKYLSIYGRSTAYMANSYYAEKETIGHKTEKYLLAFREII